MSLIYKILYGVGFTPWEEMAELPIAEQISAMFDREEEGRQPPYGPALDLGCGSGIWGPSIWQDGDGRSLASISYRRPSARRRSGHRKPPSKCGSSKAM